jgi:hypothetical protein
LSDELRIDVGDKLEWRMDLQNNERVAVVKIRKSVKDVSNIELARYSIKQKRKSRGDL